MKKLAKYWFEIPPYARFQFWIIFFMAFVSLLSFLL